MSGSVAEVIVPNFTNSSAKFVNAVLCAGERKAVTTRKNIKHNYIQKEESFINSKH